MKNIVAIVGRPNVGKSTLFNKLIGKRISIVHNKSGITRDRLYHKVKWIGKDFLIIDTGGIELDNKPFQEQIRFQAEIAIKEAKIIILVVDGKVGITSDDEFIINILRKSNQHILLAANKLEGNKTFDSSLWKIGLTNIFPISAIHGEGIGNLLDKIVKELKFDEIAKKITSLKIAIIGRPNAGKSSLINVLAKEKRSIVSSIPGTTRDSVNFLIKINDIMFNIVDTAGINKKSKLIESVDHYALLRALSSLEESNITLLIIDATRKLSHFDARVAGYAMSSEKPIILVINKWDLIKKHPMSMKEYEDMIRKEFKFLSWAPIVFISVINKTRLNKLEEAIILVYNNLNKRIKTSFFNEILMDIQSIQPAPLFRGGRLHIIFGKQVESPIPKFVLFINNKKYLHFSYKRYIENQFRKYLGFKGTPIKIVFKNKKGAKDE